MSVDSSVFFDSYVPVYDAVPELWEEAKPFLVERLKEHANAINIREIGWFLDEELLSGKAFIPGESTPGNNVTQQYRQILRKVIDTGFLIIGINPGVNHGILFDSQFRLIDLWVSGTDSVGLTALRITGDDVLMNATQIIITSPQAFDRSNCVIEYIQEI